MDPAGNFEKCWSTETVIKVIDLGEYNISGKKPTDIYLWIKALGKNS